MTLPEICSGALNFHFMTRLHCRSSSCKAAEGTAANVHARVQASVGYSEPWGLAWCRMFWCLWGKFFLRLNFLRMTLVWFSCFYYKHVPAGVALRCPNVTTGTPGIPAEEGASQTPGISWVTTSRLHALHTATKPRLSRCLYYAAEWMTFPFLKLSGVQLDGDCFYPGKSWGYVFEFKIIFRAGLMGAITSSRDTGSRMDPCCFLFLWPCVLVS